MTLKMSVMLPHILYSLKENLRIRKFQVLSKGTLKLDIISPKKCNKWRITSDKGDNYLQEKQNPEIQLLEGAHRYTIGCEGRNEEIVLYINYTPKEFYQGKGNTISPDVYQVSASNVSLLEDYVRYSPYMTLVNYRYYIKRVLLISWIVIFVFWIFYGFRWVKKYRRGAEQI